ncbi:MAG: hypothetical protein QOJ45_1058 [Verrucomicrobiota bacterium]|jgi:hypothetical protein
MEIEPLWRQAIPDRESWRRGREAIILISMVVLLGECVLIVATMMGGDIETFFVRLITGWLAALLLYFVWIGQNWARWLVAPIFCGYGCWDIVWGIIGSDGLTIVIGIADLIIFSYLAIAPAVYAFARHQRERVRRWEVIAITGIFFLILLTMGSGVFAFYTYQNTLKAEAMDFARMAFHRVFENRDPEYLTEHSTSTPKFLSPRAFINMMHSELGEVQSVGPFGAVFKTKFVPYHLELRGTAKTRAMFGSGGRWVSIEISGREPDWKIEHISWDY